MEEENEMSNMGSKSIEPIIVYNELGAKPIKEENEMSRGYYET